MPIPKFDGKTHNLKGGFLFIRGYPDGKMFVQEICSCGGCFDRTTEIHEGDIVVAFRGICLCGPLRKIKVVAMEFKVYGNATFDQVIMTAHDKAIEQYCGGMMFDNYGIDGERNFGKLLIKALEEKPIT